MCVLLSRARPLIRGADASLRDRTPTPPRAPALMCTLVAAGHGDALSHLLARRGVLFVVFFHVATLF